MEQIRSKATQVASLLDNKQSISPETIALVIAVIVDLIKLYISCRKTPAQAVDSMQTPGILGTIRLRWMLRKRFSRSERKQIELALRTAGRSVTLPEADTMFKEVQSNGELH